MYGGGGGGGRGRRGKRAGGSGLQTVNNQYFFFFGGGGGGGHEGALCISGRSRKNSVLACLKNKQSYCSSSNRLTVEYIQL